MQKNRLRFVKAGGAGALFLVFAAACSSDSDAPETRSLLQNQVGGAIAFDRVIDVKFKDEADVSLPPQVQSSVLSQSPLFNQPDVFEIGRAWVRLVLVEGADASQVMNQLRKASNVRLVQPAAPIAPPPVTPPDAGNPNRPQPRGSSPEEPLFHFRSAAPPRSGGASTPSCFYWLERGR